MDSLFQVPLIVSYYTKGTSYEKEVEHLIESCKKFGLECHVEAVEDRGSWKENCSYKPYFMRDKMKQLQRPLLWVDADAVFLQRLSFDEFMFSDVAFYHEPVKYVHDPSMQDPRFSTLSGTVYVNCTEGGLASLDLWCRYSDDLVQSLGSVPSYSDQISLHCMLLSKPSFHIAKLPIVYVKVFDKVVEGLAQEKVVIEHNQASRRFQHKGNANAD